MDKDEGSEKGKKAILHNFWDRIALVAVRVLPTIYMLGGAGWLSRGCLRALLPGAPRAGSWGRDALTELLAAGRDRSHVGSVRCPRCWSRYPRCWSRCPPCWSRSPSLGCGNRLPGCRATCLGRRTPCSAVPLLSAFTAPGQLSFPAWFKKKEKENNKIKQNPETRAVGKVEEEDARGLEKRGEGKLQSSPLHTDLQPPSCFGFSE